MHPQMADTDEYLKPSSLAALETDVNFTEHIATHLPHASPHRRARASRTALRPFLPSANGLLDCHRKCPLLPRAERTLPHPPGPHRHQHRNKVDRRLAVYLSLLRDGDSSSDATAIARNLHTASHEVSAALVALEEKQPARICAAVPARAQEAEREPPRRRLAR
jgi:hypothetical protein